MSLGNGERPAYTLTPGGVCRMVLPSLRRWAAAGWLREAHWFSLQPEGPRELSMDGVPLTLHHLTLPPDELAAYGRTKEKLWADIHGLPTPRFDAEDFRFYTRYNWFTGDALLAKMPDVDVVYVHDFQLLQLGALIGLAAPSVLRWHVPFDPARIPPYTRTFLLRAMEDFDAVIVSTRRDLEGLLNAGFRGAVRQLYPHIDPADWPDPSPRDVAQLEEAWGLRPDDRVVLCVGRMDPMKRQDLAIRALARVRRRHPRARLVLVGNGSFSGARRGGLSLPKAGAWAARLERDAAELGVGSSVVFAHWMPDRLLAAAYARAHAVLVASDVEGFGLTPFEGWRYGRPCIVSAGAGAAEVVLHGVNGLVFRPGDEEGLAEALDRILARRSVADRLGEAGRATVANYTVAHAAPHEAEALRAAIAAFGAT